MRRTSPIVVASALVGWLLASPAGIPPAAAHDHAEHRQQGGTTVAPSPPPSPPGPSASVHDKARAYFTDLPVVTQDGERLRFYTDVLKDRVVLVSLFFTDCKDACPLITARMAAVQDLLGEDLGGVIRLVSVSVDPATDTQAVIKDYAAKFGAGEGWLFLTGNEDDLRTITYRLGQMNDAPAAHPPFLMAGDTRRGYWRKFMPNVSDEALAMFLRELAVGS